MEASVFYDSNLREILEGNIFDCGGMNPYSHVLHGSVTGQWLLSMEDTRLRKKMQLSAF